MEIVEIEEKAEYIKELFEKEKYDSFYLYEARVKTKLDYYVNGRLNREYFDTEAQADLPEYIEWKDIKAYRLADRLFCFCLHQHSRGPC